MERMRAFREPSFSNAGAAARIEEWQRARFAMHEVLAMPNDSEEAQRERDQYIVRLFDGLVASAQQVLEETAAATRSGFFDSRAPDVGEVQRVRVVIGGELVVVPVMGGLDPSAWRRGQLLEITAGESSVVSDAYPDPPQWGEVLNVVRVLPPSATGEHWVEVEEKVGERRRRVQLSDYVVGTPINTGDSVRVHGWYVYERVADAGARRTEFLEEVRYFPDGSTRFEHIKGQERAVRTVRMTLDRLVDPEAYPGAELVGASIRALLGPPGCGKTMLFCAAGNYLVERLGPKAVQIFYVRASALRNMYVGNSEANARALFDEAIKAHQRDGTVTLICFEEAESTMLDRTGFDNSGGVNRGVVGTLLSYLSGADPLKGVAVFCLSNHEALLDSGMIRAGRLGGTKRVSFGRLGPEAFRSIIAERLGNGAARFTSGPAAEHLEALDSALQVPFGTCMVGHDKIEILGQHLTSGAAATDCLEGAADLLHEHLYAMREKNGSTPFNTVSAGMLYHGALRSLNGILASHAGRENVLRARDLFSGGLVKEADAKSLTEVHAFPLERLPVPDQYDLTPMLELEGCEG